MAKHFDDRSVRRISDVVRAVEATGIDNLPPVQKHPASSRLTWFLLVEDFDENLEADGAPGNWSASADNDGDGTGTPVEGGGFLTADPVARYTVRDTTGTIGAHNGDWVCCQWLGTENGSVWEPVAKASSFDRISGRLTAATTGSNFTIDNISVIQGKDPRDDKTSTTETVSVANTLSWSADDNATCFAQWSVSLNGGVGGWEAYQVACP